MAETNTFKTDELKQKVQHVISLYNNIKEEKEALVGEKIHLLKTIEQQKLRIAEMESEYNTLQMAKAVAAKNQGETEIAKKRIDAIVREIDKCIALLNK